MSNNNTFTTKIILNASEAKKEIDELDKKVANLKKQRDAAFAAGDMKEWKKLGDEIEKDEKKLGMMRGQLESIKKTLENMSDANPKQLRDTIKEINRLLSSGQIKRGSDQWKALTASLRQARAEQAAMNAEMRASQSIWSRGMKWLNTNWGAMTQILGAASGLTLTIRKAVQDYADMEEAMADTRKYTGLTDEAVRELNEDLKKMNTRTSREELNELAGVAGRLGITAKDSILEFVDAADMIKVALGDDLGEGAIDNVGKLAMAFGEDKEKGLRGAMLATGSAINELAQNSSAQAGYLVDFTARVAGFGKQMGLTQAQIMGFGAVMDENLLRDEMSATAFGNMLTKMQTDTAKFAKIAGQDVKDFTKLLNEDANAAILAVADSLRSQDPQTMMKMLDDMGLDGSRAVGVLSTLADKIDDVRQRQKLATEAYEEGSSVIEEFGVMNNTVQARLDKCKKQFHEMTVELGEQLLPIVKYTCTGFSLLVKSLSTTSKFVMENKTAIAAAGAGIAAYTVYVNAATIATKAQTIAINIAKAATEAFNFVTKMNPIGLLVAALTAATLLFIKYRDRISGATEATSMLRSSAAKLMAGLAGVGQWFVNLIKWAASLYDKFSFLRKIVQLLVTAFTAGFTTISMAVKLLIDELEAVGNIIEGIFTLDWDKIKEGYKQGFKAVADAAVAQFNNVKRTIKGVFSAPPPPNGNSTVADGVAVGAAVAKGTGGSQSNELPEVVVQGKRRSSTYESETERKAREKKEKEEERKRRKAEADAKKERREQDKQLKAETDQRLADELVSYSLGLTGYLQYLEKRKQIQLEGIAERKKIFEEGSAEWLRLDAKEKQLLAHGDDETRKMSLKEMERNHQMTKAMMEAQFYDEKSTLYHNEEELNEALYQEDVAFLKEKAELYQKGSLERMELEWQIEDMEEQHKLERQRTFEEQVLKIREEYLNKGRKMQMDIELNALETLHQKGLLEEEEYQRARLAIRAKYATNPAQDTKDAFSSKVSDSLSVAREKAGDANVSNPWTGDLTNYMKTNEQLKELYKSDQMTYAEYIAAKGQNLSEFLQSVVDKYEVAYQQVAAVLNAANAYSKACSDYEVAVVEKNYEKQIAAAGNNKKKVKKLEEKKQKEISAIKSKANERAMKIEIAQAIASTAMGAINAYSSAAEVPLIGYILAPIAAAAAVAAGMLQVATIKKQHQTEALGYYSGGFTGGRQYRREAGVVHEGEFVANHQAVGNPAILPFLNFLDQAQRNNTVGSLTPQDVSQQLGTGTSAVVAPVINVQTDNEQLNGALAIVSEGISNLNQILIQGIEATVAIDGPNGLDRQYTRYQKMKNRV